MPMYEYACRSCGHEFETLVRGSDAPSCTQCASPELEKKLSVFASPGSEQRAASACGTCGDPRGPGSCALN